jgi:hypothetical protein
MAFQLTSIRGAQTIVASVIDQDPIRLSIHGPLFDVVEVEVNFARRDVRWRVDSVLVTGFFDEVRDDPDGWVPPDMITISLHNKCFQPKWLLDWIAKQMPGVS